jgi:cobalt/nickel transport system permease protein
MHIAEGVLSPAVLAGGALLAAAGTAVGLRRLDYDRLMTVALLAAAFFVATLVHVPIGPASVHLVLGGLLGALLGWACFPAILVALALQAVLFQHGGITALGANCVIMALPPLLCHFAFRGLLRRPGRARAAGAFACGFVALLLSGLLAAVALVLTGEAFAPAAKVLVLANLPLAAVEGVVTLFAVSFLARVRPEMLEAGLIR